MKEITKEERKRLKSIYGNMIRRCTANYGKEYKYYGSKGIKVCDRWLESFENFVEDMYNNEYNETKTIDRIDGNGNYEPSNCRWLTRAEQNRNKTNAVIVKYQGKERRLIELCEMFNADFSLVWKRYFRYHWSLERALRQEPKKRTVKAKQ